MTGYSCTVAHFNGDGSPAPCPDELYVPVDDEPWPGHSGRTWLLDGVVVCQACAPMGLYPAPPRRNHRWLIAALAVLALIAWRKR